MDIEKTNKYQRLIDGEGVDAIDIDDCILTLSDAVDKLIAENARLQAIIDEANAQEPVGVFNGKFNVSINDKITFEVNCYDALPEAGARLYAAPIPTQQSVDRDTIIDVLLSIGSMSEGIIADAIISAIGARQSPAVADRKVYSAPKAGTVSRAAAKSAVKQASYSPATRITEQDGKEIVKAYLMSCIGAVQSFDSFIVSDEGRALLEKLNK